VPNTFRDHLIVERRRDHILSNRENTFDRVTVRFVYSTVPNKSMTFTARYGVARNLRLFPND